MTEHGWETPPRYNEGDMFRARRGDILLVVEQAYYWDHEWFYLLFYPADPALKDYWIKDGELDILYEKVA